MRYRLKPLIYTAAILLCMMLMSSCGLGVKHKAYAETGGHERLSVICTVFPSFDFARRIAEDCDGVGVRLLLPPGSESHDYEPSLEDIAAIGNCDLLICVGGETDKWLNNVLNTIGDEGQLHVLRLLDCTDTLAEELLEGMEAGHDHDHGDYDNHSHDGYDDHGGDDHVHEADEHVWTSLRRSCDIVRCIQAEMTERCPEYGGQFSESAKELIADLEELDGEFSALTEGCDRKTLVFADRFPFRYLAEDYGLECYAAFPGCTSDAEPSLATLNFLLEKVKEADLPAVLTIEFSKGTAAKVIAGGASVKTLTLHSCHNISGEELDAGIGYVDLMRRNLAVLKEALG